MNVNEFTNPQLVLNNPVAVAVWAVASCISGIAISYGAKYSARYGWRGTKWAGRRIASVFRSAAYSNRAKSVLALLEAPTSTWTVAGVPDATGRKLDNGELKVARPASIWDAKIVAVGTTDLLFGLPKAERKAIARAAVALLDRVAEADALAKAGVPADPVRQSVVEKCGYPSLATQIIARLDNKAREAKVAVSGITKTVAEIVEHHTLFVGSSGGGYDLYVRLETIPGVFGFVKVATGMSSMERDAARATDGGGSQIALYPVPRGALPTVC